MANNVNVRIIEEGTIVEATKLPVYTIGLGEVAGLKDLEGVIWHNSDGDVVVATKEAPEGCVYEQGRTAVVRIIGDEVKIDGLYDLYAPDDKKVQKLLSNPFSLDTLPADMLTELQPILDAASEVRPSIAPAEHGRKVIIITDDMVSGEGYIECHCPWDPEDVLTKLYPGDIFLVEDEENAIGYRIGKKEFAGTHVLED